MTTPRIAWPCAGDGSFKPLPYQLSMFGYWPNTVATGNGGPGPVNVTRRDGVSDNKVFTLNYSLAAWGAPRE